MITNLRQQRPARTAPVQASIRSRPGSVPGIRDVPVESASDGGDELTRKLSTLEAEVLGLRRTLAEVTANREQLRKEMEDLRHDRDHWRKLAYPGKPNQEGAEQKTWFCGRASKGV
jgi:hypothetical protein